MDATTLTAPAATIPAPEFNASERVIESRIETSIPGIFLTVSTSHRSGFYTSRLDRVQISEKILSMKIDAARFSDLPPVTGRKISTARYSAKNLRAFHEVFAEAVEEKLAEALVWAERY